jgi:Flp pilus assembly protein TadG
MVETALVLPIMMMVLLGTVEFGRAFMVCQLLTNAAREGTRLGVIPGMTNTDVETEVETLVADTVGVAATEITITIAVTDFATGAALTDLSVADKRDLVDVRVQVPYDAVSLAPVNWMTGVNLTGQSAMRHE